MHSHWRRATHHRQASHHLRPSSASRQPKVAGSDQRFADSTRTSGLVPAEVVALPGYSLQYPAAADQVASEGSPEALGEQILAQLIVSLFAVKVSSEAA